MREWEGGQVVEEERKREGTRGGGGGGIYGTRTISIRALKVWLNTKACNQEGKKCPKHVNRNK